MRGLGPDKLTSAGEPGSFFIDDHFPHFSCLLYYGLEMSWSSPNSECLIDSEALDYIPDYDIETKGKVESLERRLNGTE